MRDLAEQIIEQFHTVRNGFYKVSVGSLTKQLGQNKIGDAEKLDNVVVRPLTCVGIAKEVCQLYRVTVAKGRSRKPTDRICYFITNSSGS